MVQDDRLILVAQVGGSFGVRGEVRITTFTAEPMTLLESPLMYHHYRESYVVML